MKNLLATPLKVTPQLIYMVIGVCAVLGFLNIQAGHYWGGDFSLYLAQTQALIDGNMNELYEANKFSMDHSEHPLGPYMYPMGFCYILFPLVKVLGMNFFALKVFNLIFLLGSVGLLYPILQRLEDQKSIAFFATALYAVNYQILYFADRIGTEFSFMFFCLLAIYLMRKEMNLTRAVLVGIIIAMCYSIRVTGLLLLPTLAVFHLTHFILDGSWKKKWAIILAPYLFFALGWALYSMKFGFLDNAYEDMLKISFESLKNMTLFYGEALTQLLIYLKLFPPFLKVVIAIFFFTLCFIGLFKTIKVDNLFLIAFPAFLTGLYIVFPLDSLRFIVQTAPFLLYFFIRGIAFCINRVNLLQPFGKYIFIGLTIAALIQTCGMTYMQRKNGTNTTFNPEIQKMYGYIKNNIPKDEIIIFRKPRVIRFFTERNSIMVHDYQGSNAALANYCLIEPGEEIPQGFILEKEWKVMRLLKRE